jgi:hypothetical protein
MGRQPSFEAECRMIFEDTFDCEIRDPRVSLKPSWQSDSRIHEVGQVTITYGRIMGSQQENRIATFLPVMDPANNCKYQQLGVVKAGALGDEEFPPVYEIL